jgi:hypothetical protein
MSDKDDCRGILLEILRTGLLRIRVLGWSGQADQCTVEADHLHNLPELILNPQLELLAYYFDNSRPAFITTGVNTEQFDSLWKQLESILDKMRTASE